MLVRDEIENHLNEKLIAITKQHHQIIQTIGGRKYFLKYFNYKTPQSLIYEAKGLELLRESKTVNVPQIYCRSENWLLLEYIDEGRGAIDSSAELLGKQLAQMHKIRRPYFGLDYDNYIGLSQQKNSPPFYGSWPEFYFEYRLKYQYKLSERKGIDQPYLTQSLGRLEKIVFQLFDGVDLFPSLLHGDLWGGNFLISQSGQPYLIDPAIFFGDREADMAMTTLFGGFPSSFYDAYHLEFPLRDGYEEREGLYHLYHLWNHYNIFGESYYSQLCKTIKKLLQLFY